MAVDDIGTDPFSLAMLPLLEPDVIEFDKQLVHQEASQQTAQVINAAALDPADPPAQEWTVVAISPFFAAALIAHDTMLDAAGEEDRKFDDVVCYDRSLVMDAGRLIMPEFDGGIDT